MSKKDQQDKLLTVVSAIRVLKDTQNNFYRDNEADYYHRILRVIEFFQDISDDEIANNHELFMKYLHIMSDFRDLFLELYDDSNYAKPSAKKSNFYHTIDTLNKLIDSFKERTDKIKTATSTELEDIRQELKKIQQDSQLNYEEYRDKIAHSTKVLESSKKEFLDTKRAIEEESRLYASQRYWSEKKQKHKKLATILSIVFVFIIGLLIALTASNLQKLDKIYINDINITSNVKDIKSHRVGNSAKYLLMRVVESLLILSLLIWIARIVLKIIFSNLHLKEEAYEKETMIVTYLALIKEGGGLSGADRGLILESIFRPSTNGLIKDESSVTLLDVMNVFKTK